MAWSEIYELPVQFPYQFHLHGFSDLQLGSESTSDKVIDLRIHEIEHDPVDSGTIILGDIEDDDRPSTRITKASAFADRPEVISNAGKEHMMWLDKWVIPRLVPIHANTKYGILGVLAGHHWTQLSPVLNSVQYMCHEISRLSKRKDGTKVRYLSQMAANIDLRFRPPSGRRGIDSMGFVQHGEGGGQTKASTITKLERAAQGHDADWYMRGHDCQILASKTDKLRPRHVRPGTAPEQTSRTICYLNLGAATRAYEMNQNGPPSYVEQGMMRPTTMGWGTLWFNIRKAWKFEDLNQNYKLEMKIVI